MNIIKESGSFVFPTVMEIMDIIAKIPTFFKMWYFPANMSIF